LCQNIYANKKIYQTGKKIYKSRIISSNSMGLRLNFQKECNIVLLPDHSPERDEPGLREASNSDRPVDKIVPR
jgi:hypothetical protein